MVKVPGRLGLSPSRYGQARGAPEAAFSVTSLARIASAGPVWNLSCFISLPPRGRRRVHSVAV